MSNRGSLGKYVGFTLITLLRLQNKVLFSLILPTGTPYWAASGEKQYYISKKCATSDNCEPSNKSVSQKCDRIWYNDWTCVECCTGDRCNYYVTVIT